MKTTEDNFISTISGVQRFLLGFLTGSIATQMVWQIILPITTTGTMLLLLLLQTLKAHLSKT